MKTTDVIIPARNEAANVAKVVSVFTAHPKIRRVFVAVDPDTTDDTANVAAHAGAKIVWPREGGKGQVVKAALRWVMTERVIFCDADVLGLERKHVDILARPHVGMTVGVPDIPLNFPKDREWAWPFVSGERSLPAHLARQVNLHGYLMEVQLNQHMTEYPAVPVRYVRLTGLVSPYRMTPKRIAERDRDFQWGVVNGVLRQGVTAGQ